MGGFCRLWQRVCWRQCRKLLQALFFTAAMDASAARRSKWTVEGRAPLLIPEDPWRQDSLPKLREDLQNEAAKIGVDLARGLSL